LAGWRCGWISSTDNDAQQFWIVAAEREDTGRFIVTSNPFNDGNRNQTAPLGLESF
jgi:hypothetical protein